MWSRCCMAVSKAHHKVRVHMGRPSADDGKTPQTLESEQLGCKARFHYLQAVWNVPLWLFPQRYNGGNGVCLWFCYNWRKVKVKVLVAQSGATLCDPMDCSLLGSSVHGILLERILEWLPWPSPGDLPDPGIEPGSPALQADSLLSEPPGKPIIEEMVYIKSQAHKNAH